MNIEVVKRNGDVEAFNTLKIKKVIEWACEGLDVNQLELESRIEDMAHDGVTTMQIHDGIIHQAQSLARSEAPDWVYVAGRLNTMKRWKETGAYDKSFREYFRNFEGYTHPVLTKYSDEDLDFLGYHIKQERDLAHSYGSTLTAEKKYLMDGECIQQMFMVEAMIVFHRKDLNKVVEFYNALSLRKISLATPWLSNLRSGGNIASCFIIAVDDDLENIADGWKKAAKISKMGGGLGIYMGNLRAKGSSIGGRANSAKSVGSPAKVFNDIAIYVDQGGKRAGAFTLALPVWHNDIEGFLHIQSETGDQRTKAHDIFPQICVPDLFMERVKEDSMWSTFCPKEAKDLGYPLATTWGEEFERNYFEMEKLGKQGILSIYGEYSAKGLLKEAMRTMFDSGLPYVFFTDTVNRANPNKHDGMIPCSNLCVESYSNLDPYNYTHTCNLASVVAGRMDSLEDVRANAALLCEVLNEGIALTNPPVESSRKHNLKYATIGIGVQGLHDWLAKHDKFYEDIEFIQEFFEYVQYGAVEKSIELAKTEGSYPAFIGSDWHNGAMIERFKSFSNSNLDWDYLQQGINLHGIRNSQMTSPAPNTSTSVFMDAAAGVSPVYSPFFREDNDNGKYPVTCMFIKDKAYNYNRSFRTYDQSDLTASIGAMQKFVDTGISAEYLFDQNKPNFSAKDLYDMILNAWLNGTKCIYYIRSIKKGETVEDLLGIKEESCSSCSG